jgi:hypothetical protein
MFILALDGSSGQSILNISKKVGISGFQIRICIHFVAWIRLHCGNVDPDSGVENVIKIRKNC